MKRVDTVKKGKVKNNKRKCIYFEEEAYECVLKLVASFRSAVHSASTALSL